MANPSYLPAPQSGTTPSSVGEAAAASWVRRIADVVNNMLKGKLNCTGQITLTANATSTTIIDARIGPFSIILLSPTTQNAAALDALYWWVSAQSTGTATITHASLTTTDRSYNVAILG